MSLVAPLCAAPCSPPIRACACYGLRATTLAGACFCKLTPASHLCWSACSTAPLHVSGILDYGLSWENVPSFNSLFINLEAYLLVR